MATKKTSSRAQPAKSRQPVGKSAPGAKVPDAMRQALDPSGSLATRVKALARVDVLASAATFGAVLGLVSATSLRPALRRAALAALQSATFRSQEFGLHRTRFIAALRRLRRDADTDLRSRVLGILARLEDSSTMELLLEGLRDPKRALLPPEKALQLLGNNIHSGVFEVASAIAKDAPSDTAKREALRILAGSPDFIDYFDALLRNKAETVAMRQVAASSLNHMAPGRLLAAARELVMDGAEDSDMRGLGLTALANFGDRDALKVDAELHQHVDQMNSDGAYSGTALKTALGEFKRRCSA